MILEGTRFQPLLNKRIAIVGGGWYGCHLACELSKLGAKITLFEKEFQLLQGASGYSTFRLHIGPHYPRDQLTRAQLKESFQRFIEKYEELVIDQHKALYAIGDIDSEGRPSLISGSDFVKVCKECDPGFTVEDPEKHGVSNVEILCGVNEKTVSVDQPRFYFKRRLSELKVDMRLGSEINNVEHTDHGDIMINAETFDWCLNCTYYRDLVDKSLMNALNVFYEVCVSFFYAPVREEYLKDLISISIFDGNFPSLDPYVTERHGNEGPLYLLTHAKYTPLKRFDNFENAERFKNGVKKTDVADHRCLIEQSFIRFYEDFYKDFKYHGYFLSIKTKVQSDTDFRGTVVWREPSRNMIHVCSGKISTIFQAEDEVKKILL